jgi:hypothetical protein
MKAIKAQMLALRETLGNAGNLQLTDGEVTLRPETEVIELLRYARSIGLIPMLMTHGDSFRRRPGLLERLMRENLGGVSDVMRWLAQNADAFRMLSFLPIAQVGRTEGRLRCGVAVESLWREIERGLIGHVAEPATMERGHKWLGHPACNRFVHGIVVREKGRRPRFYPARYHVDPMDERVVDTFLARVGGITFRADSRAERIARLCALVLHAPGFAARNVLPYAGHWLRRVGNGSARSYAGIQRDAAEPPRVAH